MIAQVISDSGLSIWRAVLSLHQEKRPGPSNPPGTKPDVFWLGAEAELLYIFIHSLFWEL